jgi:hypothetical protein
MLVDVIILTNSDVNSFYCHRTIHTLLNSETEIEFNIIVVESGTNHEHIYKGLCNTYLHPNEKFNYNRFLNFGSKYCKGEWVVISNDDVSYELEWFSQILKVHHQRPDIKSFSPRDPLFFMAFWANTFISREHTYQESYQVSKFLMGWCLIIKMDAFKEICPFDELFDMYYQDNDYAETIKSKGIKHALVKNSIVSHYNTLNIRVLEVTAKPKMEEDEQKFRNKWKIYT